MFYVGSFKYSHLKITLFIFMLYVCLSNFSRRFCFVIYCFQDACPTILINQINKTIYLIFGIKDLFKKIFAVLHHMFAVKQYSL